MEADLNDYKWIKQVIKDNLFLLSKQFTEAKDRKTEDLKMNADLDFLDYD